MLPLLEEAPSNLPSEPSLQSKLVPYVMRASLKHLQSLISVYCGASLQGGFTYLYAEKCTG